MIIAVSKTFLLNILFWSLFFLTSCFKWLIVLSRILLKTRESVKHTFMRDGDEQQETGFQDKFKRWQREIGFPFILFILFRVFTWLCCLLFSPCFVSVYHSRSHFPLLFSHRIAVHHHPSLLINYPRVTLSVPDILRMTKTRNDMMSESPKQESFLTAKCKLSDSLWKHQTS